MITDVEKFSENELLCLFPKEKRQLRLYQRKPVRCSSAISLMRASVRGRLYCPQAARMASNSAIGATYDAPNDVDSIEAMNNSLHSRASGERYVSEIPTQ